VYSNVYSLHAFAFVCIIYTLNKYYAGPQSVLKSVTAQSLTHDVKMNATGREIVRD